MKPSDSSIKLRPKYSTYLLLFIGGIGMITLAFIYSYFILQEEYFDIISSVFPIFFSIGGIASLISLLYIETLELYDDRLIIKSIFKKRVIYLNTITHYICRAEDEKQEKIIFVTEKSNYGIDCDLINYKKLKDIFAVKLKREAYLEELRKYKRQKLSRIAGISFALFVLFILTYGIFFPQSSTIIQQELMTFKATLSKKINLRGIEFPYNILTEEYPTLKFKIGDINFDSLTENDLVIRKGTKVEIDILKEDYEKKIAKTKDLSFSDKFIQHRFVSVYGFRSNDKDYLNVEKLEEQNPKEEKMYLIMYLLIGCFLIVFISIQIRYLLKMTRP